MLFQTTVAILQGYSMQNIRNMTVQNWKITHITEIKKRMQPGIFELEDGELFLGVVQRLGYGGPPGRTTFSFDLSDLHTSSIQKTLDKFMREKMHVDEDDLQDAPFETKVVFCTQ